VIADSNGLNGVDNGTISFDNVVIPKEKTAIVLLSLMIRENLKPIPSDNRRFFTPGNFGWWWN
jgi:acyl-CoA oxidase